MATSGGADKTKCLFPEPTDAEKRTKYAYRCYNLVDLKDDDKKRMDKVNEDVQKLIKQLDETIIAFEKEHFPLKVNKFYIGKTYVTLKNRKDQDRTSHVEWDIVKRKTYIYQNNEGISDRKSKHTKEEYGNVGLVVLALVTNEVVPQTKGTPLPSEKYALMLEQRLIHYHVMEDERCHNTTFDSGKKQDKKEKKDGKDEDDDDHDDHDYDHDHGAEACYVIYMTLGSDQWQYNKITKK